MIGRKIDQDRKIGAVVNSKIQRVIKIIKPRIELGVKIQIKKDKRLNRMKKYRKGL